MAEELNIVYRDQPEWATIGRGITDYNKQQAGDTQSKTLCFVLESSGGEVVGGVIGSTYWDWLYVDLMWISEEFRGRGYGHQLLMRAEELARERGAKHAYLDTFSFQAPDFYKKHGYKVFGKLQEFPPGHQRFFMRKKL